MLHAKLRPRVVEPCHRQRMIYGYHVTFCTVYANPAVHLTYSYLICTRVRMLLSHPSHADVLTFHLYACVMLYRKQTSLQAKNSVLEKCQDNNLVSPDSLWVFWYGRKIRGCGRHGLNHNGSIYYSTITIGPGFISIPLISNKININILHLTTDLINFTTK